MNIKRKTDRFVGYMQKMTILVRLHAPTHAQNECDSINLFCFQSRIVTFQLSNQFFKLGVYVCTLPKMLGSRFVHFLLDDFIILMTTDDVFER